LPVGQPDAEAQRCLDQIPALDHEAVAAGEQDGDMEIDVGLESVLLAHPRVVMRSAALPMRAIAAGSLRRIASRAACGSMPLRKAVNSASRSSERPRLSSQRSTSGSRKFQSRSGCDARAEPGPGRDQPLGRQHLDGFAGNAAAGFELFRDVRFNGQRAIRVFAGNDRPPKRFDNAGGNLAAVFEGRHGLLPSRLRIGIAAVLI
jgi:hypothetical protein